jgi:FkbM family methyltransferase
MILFGGWLRSGGQKLGTVTVTISPALADLPPHLGMVRTKDGPMVYFKHDQYIGRSLETYGEYSRLEADLLVRMISPGDVVVEAGANIGAHTIPLAHRLGPLGRLYAFEPQRVVNQLLCANVMLNGLLNVWVYRAGMGATAGSIGVAELDFQSSNNFGGVGLGDGFGREPVPIVTLDGLALDRLRLLKIDVEGMEEHVLQGGQETIARHRPILYVENDRDDRSASLIRRILSLDYRLWWHLPMHYNPDNFRGVGEDIFPGVASLNMIGVPREQPVDDSGFRAILDDTSDWRDCWPS